MATRFHVGTSGYAYKEWKGSSYPTDLPAKRMLGHYATQLTALEMNNTFGRMHTASALAAVIARRFRRSSCSRSKRRSRSRTSGGCGIAASRWGSCWRRRRF